MTQLLLREVYYSEASCALPTTHLAIHQAGKVGSLTKQVCRGFLTHAVSAACTGSLLGASAKKCVCRAVDAQQTTSPHQCALPAE